MRILGARILGARIFSKSFGGKIKDFQTNVNKLELLKIFKKTAHAYFERPYFLVGSFLAGKLEPVEHKLPWRKIFTQQMHSF